MLGRPKPRTLLIGKHTTPAPLLCEIVHAAGCQRPSPPTPLTPGPIQNISGVAQGPAVRSVIPWVRFVGTKRGKHAPMSGMRRREFITLLGGAAAAWPVSTRAQQVGKLPTIGLLGATTSLVESQRVAAFVQRLRELGWIEGRTVAIEVRWAEGRNERFIEIAAEFVRLKVDVIVTQGSA